MTSAESRRGDIACVAALAVFVVLLYGSALSTGSHAWLAFTDAHEQTYGWMQHLARGLSSGYVPLWDAHTYSGRSFVGEFQAGAMYPPNILWAWLFQRDGRLDATSIEWLVLAHFVVAACGTYGLLRHWRLVQVAALAGALTFACFGAVAMRAWAQPNIHAGLAWMPLAVWAASAHLRSGRVVPALASGAVIGLQLLAGHVQPAFHTILLIGFMTLARAPRGDRLRTTVRAAGLMGVTAALVALPQLLLSAQYMSDAYRWIGDVFVKPGKLVPWRVYGYEHVLGLAGLGSLFDPWRFEPSDGNSLYFGLVGAGLCAWFLRNRAARDDSEAWRENGRWLAAAALFGLVCTLGHYTFMAAVLRPLPGFAQVRQLGRYAILFHFAAAAFVAMAVHALSTRPPSRWRWRALPVPRWLLVLLVLQTIWLLMHADAYTPQARPQLWIAIAVFALVVSAPLGPRAVALVAAGGVLVQAIAFRDKAMVPAWSARSPELAFAAPSFLPEIEAGWGRARVLQHESAGLRNNFAIGHRMQAKMGYSATMYRPFFDFVEQDWSIESGHNDLLNVRWVIAKDELPLALVATDPATGLKLYERATWLPRVFLRAQLDAADGARGADAERAIGLEVLHYDDHVQRFRLEAPAAGTAIVSEIDYPGWCARVNDRPVTIARAAIEGTKPLLREVPVDAGENVIEFEYRPFRSMLSGCG